MNERIRELAEQANIRFGRMAILDGDPRGMARFVTYSKFEKFAELIVQECVTICEQQRTKILQNPNDPSWTEHLAEVQTNIKQHFKVEE